MKRERERMWAGVGEREREMFSRASVGIAIAVAPYCVKTDTWRNMFSSCCAGKSTATIFILCLCFEVLMAEQHGGEGMNRIQMARAPATMYWASLVGKAS